MRYDDAIVGDVLPTDRQRVMAILFDTLQVGNEYERPFLAKLWGYKSFNAISPPQFLQAIERFCYGSWHKVEITPANKP